MTEPTWRGERVGGKGVWGGVKGEREGDRVKAAEMRPAGGRGKLVTVAGGLPAYRAPEVTSIAGGLWCSEDVTDTA